MGIISYSVFAILIPSLHFLGFPLIICASLLVLLIAVLLSLSVPSQTALPSACLEKVLLQKLSLLLNSRFSSAVITPGFQHLVDSLLNVSDHVMQNWCWQYLNAFLLRSQVLHGAVWVTAENEFEINK